MIRILMGITLSELGGSQKVVYNIISHLPEQLYEITLVTSPGGELLDWINQLNQNRNNKIRAVTLDSIRRNVSPFYDLVTFIKLIFMIKRGNFDVAHFHNSKMGTLGRIAAKISRTPKIYYTMHGVNLNKNTTGHIYPILSLLEKIIAGFTTKVIFVSKNNLDIGIHNGWASKTNACLIYNGLSEDYIPEKSNNHLNTPDQVPTIAFVARLAEPKDPLFAIRVSERLLRAGYDHKLTIIGDGPKMEECKILIHSRGLESQIFLLGKRDNAIELLTEADIFCLFSKWEGLPISIIEAMLCELPVVASCVGGIPELIEHGKNGYLVPDLDENQAEKYLKDLICDKETREKLGKQARISACNKFNLTNMVSQYRRLYEGR